MDRKEFLAGTSATAAFVLASSIGWAEEQPKPSEVAPKGTPVDKKYQFAQTYIKRLMEVFDERLTPEQRDALLEANGRACFLGSGGADHLPRDVNQFIRWIQEHEGPDVARREGNTIYFQYVKNPEGLRVKDGFCLCPLVEQGPPGLSGSFCQCSVGYVTEMFSTMVGKPVKVELKESLKRGGKACRFVIQV